MGHPSGLGFFGSSVTVDLMTPTGQTFKNRCLGARGSTTLFLLLAHVGISLVSAQDGSAQPNVLLITVDDMNRDSTGVYGSPLAGVTPHIDRLASEGLRFEHGHVTIAICQPTRAVWMTGRYPHRSGALGFDRIRPGVPTLPEALKASGYLTGLLGKTTHVIPSRHDAFETIVAPAKLTGGRSPERYHAEATEFFARAKSEERPFFLMANAHDPHRPFAGSQGDRRRARKALHPPVEAPFLAEQIPVPGFLPDLPEIRQELAQYFTSVRRADATTGALLEALDAAGFRDSTLVVFLSDHGMPLPFAKTNCWLHSTRTPWIVRWPGVVKPGVHDREHFVAGIDLAPTLLDALDLPPLPGADGRSFLPVLRGKTQPERDHVFTHINTTAGKNAYPMRSIVEARFGYIWNGWSNGSTVFKNESQSGLTFAAMKRAAGKDPGVAKRVEHFVHRVPEELYDYASDPDALHNLASHPKHADTLIRLRERLETAMESTDDPQLERYRATVLATEKSEKPERP